MLAQMNLSYIYGQFVQMNTYLKILKQSSSYMSNIPQPQTKELFFNKQC